MANIIYSDSFQKFLKNSDNPVAKFLYRLWLKSYEKTGYRGFYDSEGRRKTGHYWYEWESNLLTTKEINYLTFRSNGTISYLPAGKDCLMTANGDWSKENRQEGKPSKVIRKILTKKAKSFFSDKDFEQFTNEYKAKFETAGYTFKIEDRAVIPDVYNRTRIYGDCTLQNSCMNGEGDSLFEIYTSCKDLRIVTLTSPDGELAGRALLWSLDYEGETIQFLDRIYVGAEHLYELFLDYAKTNGFWRKNRYKTYDFKRDFVKPDGSEVNYTFTVKTDTYCEYFPYIDTFTYGDNGYLTNRAGDGTRFTYENTDGTRLGDDEDDEDEQLGEDEMYDDITGNRIATDDACTITAGDHAGDITHRSHTVIIDNDRYYRHAPDVIWDEMRGWRLIEREAVDENQLNLFA